MSHGQQDKAGKEHWDGRWKDRPLPRAIDPRSQKVGRYLERLFHEEYVRLFPGRAAQGKRLLEIGCAGSAWLPYFSREFGFRVTGIDYSELGCQQARDVLEREGVNGDIICCDAFQPPATLFGRFDVVVTYGVVEHFLDTAGCLADLARYLAPGGILMTVIPNLSGSLGAILKLLDPESYAIHVAMTARGFATAHQSAGLSLESARYFAPVNYAILQNNTTYDSGLGGRIKERVRSLLVRATFVAWYAVSHWHLPWPPTRLFSPYIIAVAGPGVSAARPVMARPERTMDRA